MKKNLLGLFMIDNDKQNFIQRLCELMKEHNEMTPTDLARAARCDLHAVCRWLDGRFFPRFAHLITLTNFFSVSIDFLLGLTEDDSLSRLDVPVLFSERLAELMKETNLTRYALAKKLEIKITTISKWFEQINMPETQTLIKMSRIFNVTIEYLVGLTSNEQ